MKSLSTIAVGGHVGLLTLYFDNFPLGPITVQRRETVAPYYPKGSAQNKFISMLSLLCHKECLTDAVETPTRGP